jgi:hypothetical protein
MLSSGAVAVDRGALRQAYLPVLRSALTAPLVAEGREGIPAVTGTLQARTRSLPQLTLPPLPGLMCRGRAPCCYRKAL